MSHAVRCRSRRDRLRRRRSSREHAPAGPTVERDPDRPDRTDRAPHIAASELVQWRSAGHAGRARPQADASPTPAAASGRRCPLPADRRANASRRASHAAARRGRAACGPASRPARRRARRGAPDAPCHALVGRRQRRDPTTRRAIGHAGARGLRAVARLADASVLAVRLHRASRHTTPGTTAARGRRPRWAFVAVAACCAATQATTPPTCGRHDAHCSREPRQRAEHDHATTARPARADRLHVRHARTHRRPLTRVAAALRRRQARPPCDMRDARARRAARQHARFAARPSCAARAAPSAARRRHARSGSRLAPPPSAPAARGWRQPSAGRRSGDRSRVSRQRRSCGRGACSRLGAVRSSRPRRRRRSRVAPPASPTAGAAAAASSAGGFVAAGLPAAPASASPAAGRPSAGSAPSALGLGRGRVDLPAQHGLRRAEHHRHVAPVLDRALLDDADLGELLGQAVEDHHAALGVRDLAAAEHDRDLDLVLVAQEALDVALLRLVVVLRDLRPELDLADRDLLLVLARLLELLGLLVLVLRVVQHAADGRARLGRDLDEVEIACPGRSAAHRSCA